MENRGLKLALRAREVSPFRVMEILERAKRYEALGQDVVHMEIGEPDFPTPPEVLAAARRHLQSGSLGYTPAGGLPQLRQAIADFYQERYGVFIEPGRIFLTPGASGALSLVLGLLIDPGDEVLIADPGYPCYPNFLRLAGGLPRAIAVDAESAFNLSDTLIAKAWAPSTRGALLASPSNPTGTVLPPDVLGNIVSEVEGRGGFVISDEIYHGLSYGKATTTALAFSSDVFVINSFSKYFGMTGWRLGWGVVPSWAAEAAERLAQNLFISAPTLSQYAAMASFSPANLEELERRRVAFDERRLILAKGLTDMGFKLAAAPEGAFYLYADVSAFGRTSEALVRDILDKTGVALTPGTDFGEHRAESHVRVSYTAPIQRIEEALERLRRFLT